MNKLLEKWEDYIQLKLMPHLSQCKIEGNIYSKPNQTTGSDLLKEKQTNILNLFSNNMDKTQVLEIGFNAGFSALLMLMINPDIKLTCVDINMHKYTEPCFNQIKKDFDNIEIIFESSSTALAKLIPNKYDIVHIDGDHSESAAKNDIDNTLKIVESESILIIDDTNMPHITRLVDRLINKNIADEIDLDKGQKYHHRAVKIK